MKRTMLTIVSNSLVAFAAVVAVSIAGLGAQREPLPKSNESFRGIRPQTTRDPRKTSNPIQRVASFDELRAREVDDVAQARFFDIYQGEKLTAQGNISAGRNLDPPYTAPPPGGFTGEDPNSPTGRLRSGICATEATIVGRVVSSRVFANSNRTWLYTKYVIQSEQLVRPKTLPRTITVSIASGVADVNGSVVSTMSLPLLEPDRIYAITARRIPDSSAFTPAGGVPILLGTEIKGEALERVNQMIEIASKCKLGATE